MLQTFVARRKRSSVVRDEEEQVVMGNEFKIE